jgi:hypothetical protein
VAGRSQAPRVIGLLLHGTVIHFIRYSDCPESGLLCSSRGLLATNLPLFSRRLQLPISLGGYEIGLEVHDDWWTDRCKSGELGALGKSETWTNLPFAKSLRRH